MSDKKENLKKALQILEGIQAELKIKLSADPTPGGDPPAEEILTSKDGKTYKVVGALEVGAEIMEQTTEGEATPQDGDIELDSGKLISVKDGKIAEIKDSPIPPDTMEEFRAQFAAQAELVKEQAKQIQSLQQLVEKILEARKAENEAILKNNDAMFSAIKEFAEAPLGGDPPAPLRTFPKTTKGGPLSRMG